MAEIRDLIEKIEDWEGSTRLKDYGKAIEEAKRFFMKIRKEIVHQKHENVIFLKLDILKQDKNLYNSFINFPEETLQILEFALDEVFPEKKNSRLRFTDIPDNFLFEIDNLRASNLNKLVKLKGYLIQASEVRPQAVNAKFECPNCKTIIPLLQISKKFIEPLGCTCGRSERFKLISKEMVDAQRIIISDNKEMKEDGTFIGGSKIAVFTQEDMTAPSMNIFDRLGEEIGVFGVLKDIPVMLDTGEVSTRFDYAIEANNLFFTKESDIIAITEKEEKKIISMAKDSLILKKMAHSIFSNVSGYLEIKDALILQLFSEVQKDNLNILIIGDPKVGKSALLKEVVKLDIRGEYFDSEINAKQAEYFFKSKLKIDSKNGLIAVDGIALLDYEANNAMLKYLKENNGGSSILACGHPKLGRFEPYQTISQQMNVSPRIINKMDLIFIIRDLPDKQKDDRVANILLKEENNSEGTLISRDLFRKYLSYAKIKVNPKLSKEAIKELREFYVNSRNIAISKDKGIIAIPLTARQLETLKKIAKAHARLRLSNEVDKGDALVAIKILKYFLKQVGFDYENNEYDVDRLEGISATSKRNIVLIMETLKKLEDRLGKFIPQEELEKNLEDLEKEEIEEYIALLVASGEIFIPKKGFIQRI